MPIEEQDSRDQLRIWQRSVIVSLWLIGPVVMGILAAIISGDHGSVVFVAVGLYVGISGAVSYLLLPLLSPFRRLGGTGRLAACAAAAALPTVAFSVYVALSDSSRSNVWSFYFEPGIATAFACICAVLVSQLESRWRFKSDYF